MLVMTEVNTFSMKREFDVDAFLNDNLFTCDSILDKSFDSEDSVSSEQHIISILDSISSELAASKIYNNTINDILEIEDGLCSTNVKKDFSKEQIFCNKCRENNLDYCTECGALIHILSRSVSSITYDSVHEEIPENILEYRESFGCSGIFALKVIPPGVRFGPFTGLTPSDWSWRMKTGTFNDRSRFLNWMQHIRNAKNTSEQNLLAYQYEDHLYYRATREIQIGEELLVYISEEYEGNVDKDIEMVFIPTIEEHIKDVFACTFCCLGFRSGMHLFKHKNVCLSGDKFPMEELIQCPFCKIYLEKEEYLQYHMIYCSEINDRKCVPLGLDYDKVETKRDTTRRCQMYQCSHCKYKTTYKSELRSHANQHYDMKIYRRMKAKESLKVQEENAFFLEIEGNQRYSFEQPELSVLKQKHSLNKHVQSKRLKKKFDYKCKYCEFRTRIKHNLKLHVRTKHLKKFSYKCSMCDYKTNRNLYFKKHIMSKHLKEFNYQCESCEYRTNHKPHLERHVKTRHLKEFNFKCWLCEFGTNNQSHLQRHIKSEHLKQYDYKCESCDYMSNIKHNLEKHTKTKHLKEFSYNCTACEFKTNEKTYLKNHIRTKHLKEFNYNCNLCDFKTNEKTHLNIHTRTKHLKQFTYKCVSCDYETNNKSHLRGHVKTIHLKELNYQCDLCDFKTNYKFVLERHTKAKHLKDIAYKCDVCDYKTFQKSHLNVHVKVKHLKEINYKCEICQFTTNHGSNLKRHMKTKHLKEFSHKCEVCDFKTNHKTQFEIHIKTKHLKEFNYKCLLCEYKTNEKRNFGRHMKAVHNISII